VCSWELWKKLCVSFATFFFSGCRFILLLRCEYYEKFNIAEVDAVLGHSVDKKKRKETEINPFATTTIPQKLSNFPLKKVQFSLFQQYSFKMSIRMSKIG
jgi:hypothetical protein